MKTKRISTKKEFEAGKTNGLRHFELSAYFQEQNETKCAAGIQNMDYPPVRAYWEGYKEGMKAAKTAEIILCVTK